MTLPKMIVQCILSEFLCPNIHFYVDLVVSCRVDLYVKGLQKRNIRSIWENPYMANISSKSNIILIWINPYMTNVLSMRNIILIWVNPYMANVSSKFKVLKNSLVNSGRIFKNLERHQFFPNVPFLGILNT